MTLQRPTIERALFLLAFLLALSLRLYDLGFAPLSDAEALPALQALAAARGASAGLELSPQPGYTLLTAALFNIFEDSAAFARLISALAGSLLVLAPYLYRRQLGRQAAILMAFGLALDPGLVTVSRQAGGPIPALAFTVLTVGLWQSGKSILAGVCAGLALMTGPQFIYGVIALGPAWLISRLFPETKIDDDAGNAQDASDVPLTPERPSLVVTLISAGLTILLAGTLLLRFPQGLSAWFEMIPAYFAGWQAAPSAPAARLLAALLVFQPLPTVFALVAIFSGIIRRPPRFVIFLIAWLLLALGFSLVYPNRQVSDLVWALVPLWGLASIQLARYLPQRSFDPVAASLAAAVVILCSLFWFMLVGLGRVPEPITPTDYRLLTLLGILALVILSTLLVTLGWSWQSGRNGLVWGFCIAGCIYLVSVMWGASHLRFNQPQELWGTPPATGQATLLRASLNELSLWNSGYLSNLEIVSSVDRPSLRWELRNYLEARFQVQLPPGEASPVVITALTAENPTLAAAYRGQDFVWALSPGWTGALPPNRLAWLATRQAPLITEPIILWARQDLFPGNTPQSPPDASDLP